MDWAFIPANKPSTGCRLFSRKQRDLEQGSFFNQGQFPERAHSTPRGWGNRCLRLGRMRRWISAAYYRIHCTLKIYVFYFPHPHLQFLQYWYVAPEGKTASLRCAVTKQIKLLYPILTSAFLSFLVFFGGVGGEGGRLHLCSVCLSSLGSLKLRKASESRFSQKLLKEQDQYNHSETC